MPDIKLETPPPREQEAVHKHQESKTMLAIILSGIAALVVVAIVVAVNYASSNGTVESAGPPAISPATRTAPATTGAGNSEQPTTVVPDSSQKQR